MIFSTDIKTVINDYILLIDKGFNNIDENMFHLEKNLNLLCVSYFILGDSTGDNDCQEPPQNDIKSIGEKVRTRFPNLGFYNTPLNISEKIGETEITVGDAIDDIIDIYSDLLDVKWYFENTSDETAIFYFKFGYRSHWGRHAKELLLYIHDFWW